MQKKLINFVICTSSASSPSLPLNEFSVGKISKWLNMWFIRDQSRCLVLSRECGRIFVSRTVKQSNAKCSRVDARERDAINAETLAVGKKLWLWHQPERKQDLRWDDKFSSSKDSFSFLLLEFIWNVAHFAFDIIYSFSSIRYLSVFSFCFLHIISISIAN